MKKDLHNNKIIVYQALNGAVEVKFDKKQETILLTQQEIGTLFGVNKSAISKHVNNIFETKELDKKSTVSKMETVQIEGKRKILRKIEYYNLDLILSIGYRINSAKATKFRQWATKTLREYIVKGYAINRKRIKYNYSEFLKTVEIIKKILPDNNVVDNESVLELVSAFTNTWFSLDAYDKNSLEKTGLTRRRVNLTANDLIKALNYFKDELSKNEQIGDLFGLEKEKDSVIGIMGNVMQSFNGKSLYGTIEEKAAHLLYFMVKNHPFIDGNKRNGAYAFVWFLKKNNLLKITKMTPETLTALTLLIAESDRKYKDKMINLVLQLLK